MNRYLAASLLLLGMAVTSVEAAQPDDEVPLEFTRLDLTDGRRLKNVKVKSYDAKTQRLLVIADGKAMMIPVASVPEPFREQLKGAPAAGESVTTVSTPVTRTPVTAADQYSMERRVPVRQPPVVYVNRPTPTAHSTAPIPMPAQTDPRHHQEAARARAQRYYRYEHQMGSNSIYVQSVSLDLSVPNSVPGWTGRYLTQGKAYIEFYDSKGRSFQRTTSTFEVTTEQKPGGPLEVIDFSRKT